MSLSEQKSANIEELTDQYQVIAEGIEDDNLFPGFAQRLNEVLDKVQPPLPPLFGRPAALAAVLGLTKATTGRWINENKPPHSFTMRKLSIWLAENTHFLTAAEMEIYLLYGNREPKKEPAVRKETDYRVYALVTSRLMELQHQVGQHSITTVVTAVSDLLKILDIPIDTEAFETLDQTKLTAIDALILSYN